MANSKRKCKYHSTATREYIVVNNMAFCSFDFAVKWANENKNIGKNKIQASKNKEFNKRKADFYLNDTPKQHKLTQTVFNRLRVLQEIKWFEDRGLEPQCISCGKENMDWCCGHLKTRGAQSNLRYDKSNTFLQCNRYCNMGLSGNISGDKNTRGYIQGLKDRFGDNRAQEIINYCETETSHRKFSGVELKQMRKEFNKEIKKLQ